LIRTWRLESPDYERNHTDLPLVLSLFALFGITGGAAKGSRGSQMAKAVSRSMIP
jgi:hypothetical protein